MRSLRTAMRRAILGALTVGGPGCYDNPGFKLKDSETGSVEVTTNITGVTVTSEQTTMAPTTTTGDTSSGPQVSGTSTSTTEGLTTSETSSTTGPLIPWDTDCKAPEKTFDYTLLYDTFLMYEADGVGGGKCDIGGPTVIGECKDIAFGGVPSQQVFNFSAGDNNPLNFTRKVFAARFDSELLKDNGKLVPPEAIIGLTLAVHFKRIAGEKPLEFTLRRLSTNEEWKGVGEEAAERCFDGNASWRCRACTGADEEKCMGETWVGKAPYMEVDNGIAKVNVMNVDGAISIPIPDELHAEYAQLSKFHPGFVIVPGQGIPQSVIEIHTSEGKKPPRLTITYCPDPN